VHVANIRRKLGGGEAPARLVTVRGVGYRLVPV
jgi:DNA-binding response OmpR family regulator